MNLLDGIALLEGACVTRNSITAHPIACRPCLDALLTRRAAPRPLRSAWRRREYPRMDTFTDDPFPASQIDAVPYPRLDRHRCFAERYVIDFDGAAALEAAGYQGSPSTASARASSVLLNPAVAVYVEHLLRRQASEAEHTAQEVLAELWRNHRAAQSEGDLKTSNAALVAYGKHLGMFAERSISVSMTLEQLVRQSMTQQQVAAQPIEGERAPPDSVLIAPGSDTKQ